MRRLQVPPPAPHQRRHERIWPVSEFPACLHYATPRRLRHIALARKTFRDGGDRHRGVPGNVSHADRGIHGWAQTCLDACEAQLLPSRAGSPWRISRLRWPVASTARRFPTAAAPADQSRRVESALSAGRDQFAEPSTDVGAQASGHSFLFASDGCGTNFCTRQFLISGTLIAPPSATTRGCAKSSHPGLCPAHSSPRTACFRALLNAEGSHSSANK